MAEDQSSSEGNTDQQNGGSSQNFRQNLDPGTRAMLEQQETEAFWNASVEREAASGDRYMGDYHVHNSAIDSQHLEFLIMITSVIVTFVLAGSSLLATYTGIVVPVPIQISGTIAVISVINYYRGPNTDGEEGT